MVGRRPRTNAQRVVLVFAIALLGFPLVLDAIGVVRFAALLLAGFPD